MYRNPAVKVILLLLLVASTTWGQRKPRVVGPRATALAVLAPDGKTVTRLIPVCIRDNGQFWDASIYQASPRPMALDSGVVYEIERTGDPIGLFTVTEAVQQNGSWFATGDWQPPRAHLAKIPDNVDEQRPVLRRAEPSSQTSAPAHAPLPLPPVSSDPDRPVLKRGVPAVAASAPSVPADLPPAKNAGPSKIPQMVPAISDAGGPDPRPYTIDLKPDQQAHLRQAATTMLEQAVLKQAGTTAANAHLEFQENDARFFDLDGNNSSEIVLTARVELQPQTPVRPARRHPRPRPSTAPSVAQREFFVTLIAREDLEGTLHLALIRITDSRNLDLDGRLQLIDAVDVDGDGRGELLFRRLIGKNINYVVYKVGFNQADKLFDSAGE